MADIQLIRGSNGNGAAVRPVVTAARSSGSLTIKVNSTTNLPTRFIGTWGKINQETGKLVSSTIRDFYGQLNGSDIDLVRMADGFTDDGNEVGDVIVIKPNTDWTHNLADALLVSHNPDGTLKDGSAIPGVIGVGALPAGFDMTNLDSLKTLGNGIYQNTNVAVNAPAPYGFLRVAKHTDGKSFTFEYSIIGDKAAGLWQLAINENTVAPVTWTMIAGGGSTYFEVPPAITTHGGTNWAESSSLGFLKVVDGFVVGARYSVSFAINFVRDDNASGHGFVLRKANEDGSGAIELSRTEQYGRNGSSWVGHACQGSFVATGTKQRIYANIRIANGTTVHLASGTSKATFIINRVDF